MTEVSDSIRETISEIANVERLDFSHNALTVFPPDILSLPSLKRITLFGNRLSVVCCSGSSVDSLDIGSNQLTCLPQGFPDLTSLNSDWNAIESVEFAYPKLNRLCLSSNRLRFINPGLAFPELRLLDVSRNFLHELPDLSLFCPFLTRLDASNNEISAFPIVSESLRFVNLSRNRISELPPEITDSNIEHLNISFNFIEALPEMPISLRTLCIEGNSLSAVQPLAAPSLAEAIFSRNRLTSFPVFASTRLRELRLDHNHIESLEVSECSQVVTRLDLSFNFLTDLTFELFTLPNLRELNVSYNGIVRLPDGLSGPSLHSLNLTGNPLHSLPPLLPATLERLILCDCGLSQLPASYASLPELIDLDASSNAISALPPFPHLQRLSMSGNHLAAFPPVALDSLVHVDLSCNCLEALPPVLDCPRARFIDISHNRLTRLARLQCPLLLTLVLTGNASLSAFLSCAPQFPRLRFLEISGTRVVAPTAGPLTVAARPLPVGVGYVQLRGRSDTCEGAVVDHAAASLVRGLFGEDSRACAAARGLNGDDGDIARLQFADDEVGAIAFVRGREIRGCARGPAAMFIASDNGELMRIDEQPKGGQGEVMALGRPLETRNVCWVGSKGERWLIIANAAVGECPCAESVARAARNAPSPERLARRIAAAARERGVVGNITVVVYRFV
jgi:Leucine-rich repeat (LRR) protein